MKPATLVLGCALLAGCAGDCVYGRDNPNLTANASATGAGVVVVAGLLGAALFVSIFEDAIGGGAAP